jgi:hypothetical protein
MKIIWKEAVPPEAIFWYSLAGLTDDICHKVANAGVVVYNPTRGMDVCVHLFSAYVVLCVGRGLATAWSPVQGVLPTVYRMTKPKMRSEPNEVL